MNVVLQAILERFDILPARPDAERPRLRAVTFIPSRGAEIIATPRAASI
jgi:hypothetical protein